MVSCLLSVLHQAGSTTLDGVSYTYDAAGNRMSKTALPSNVASAYSYDPAYELTKVMQGATQKESYTYDAVGNRTYQPGAPYTYNSSNEMLAREGVPYTYDADGNTSSKTNGSGTTSYAWDFENRLTSVTLPGTGGVVSFKYDPFGRRIQKSNPSGTTAYVYDGDNIIEELTGTTGTLSERYTYGPGIDEPLVGQRQPQIFYYEADGLGSVTSLTTPSGSVAATYTYDSFGFMTASTGSATNWYRYAARQFDSDTALYYYRARYYDPTTGRFLSEDPVRFQAGVNFYSYVRNNPLNFVDPAGLCPNKKQPIDCDTVLPNGETLGQVVQQERGIMQNAFDAALLANQKGSESDPLLQVAGTFFSIVRSNGPIDFKNNFRGQANANLLGQEGNFAFYAVGSGYLPNQLLDAGAGAYGLLTAIFGSRPFSDLTGPMFSDSSAASVRDLALASNGCSE